MLRDLSDDLALTHRLLVDTRAWKHRLVEQVTLGSAEYYTVRRSYQVEFGRELFEGRLRPSESVVRVLVPLTSLPKEALLGFDLQDEEGKSLSLELRRSGSVVQATYLAALAAGDGLPQDLIDDSFPEQLLDAICAFTPAYSRELAEGCDSSPRWLRTYLADGLGFPVPVLQFAEVSRLADEAGCILRVALGEVGDRYSSSENVLLAIPLVDPRPRDPDDVVELVRRFHAGVLKAHEAHATEFLSTLAEYGRRWEALVELEVPLGTPSVVKMVDRRPLEVQSSRFLPWYGLPLRFRIALGEARSYHLAVSSEDESLRLGSWTVSDVDGFSVPPAVLEGARHTPEVLSAYSSVETRPYFASVEARVRAATEVLIVSGAVCLLSLVALVGCVTGSDDPERLGVLAVPTTFAVAILQTRERVSLLTRLQRIPNLVMLTTLLVLWATVVMRLATEG